MLEINESNNFKSEKDLRKKINIEKKIDKDAQFNIIIKYFSNINQSIYNELSNNNNYAIIFLNYTEKLVTLYLNQKSTEVKKALLNKIVLRNISYLEKIFHDKRNKFEIKTNKNNLSNKSIFYFFIFFSFNILKYVIISKNIDNLKVKYKKIFILNKLLKISFNITGLFYLKGFIDDDFLESLLKFNLFLSLSTSIKKIPNEKDEIINMMFFNNCIHLIKDIFNKLYIAGYEYTEKQEDLIDHIILFINNKILGSLDKKHDIRIINKKLLSKNDYKTSALLNLSYIISKTKSESLEKNYINLLTDIYAFSFKLDNCMNPNLQLLSPLFINIQKKNIKQIKNEIKLSDISLSFINSVIQKENSVIRKNPLLLRQGFYFGNNSSGITCEINPFENDFIIMLGFELESNDLESMILFDIWNKSNKSIIKFYIEKTINNDIYELMSHIESQGITSTRVNIYAKTSYIFIFHFKLKGKAQITISYVREDEKNKPNSTHMYYGKELTVKNFKNENLVLYIGYENSQGPKRNLEENTFRGFIGDIFILNTKNIKEKNEKDLENNLLNLDGNYKDILSILSENKEGFDFKNQEINNNPSYIKVKENIINLLNNSDIKMNKFVNDIISSKHFKLIDYQDDIDCMNYNYEYYQQKKDTIFKLEKKYLDIKVKSESIEDNKIIQLKTSLFNKFFHTFEREFTIFQFLKYDGIHYLSLLLEYYYQIICHLRKIKDKCNKDDLTSVCDEINLKIFNILKFFYSNIIIPKLTKNNLDEIKQFFYQISVTILKLTEIYSINYGTIKHLVDILKTFNSHLGEYIKNKEDPTNILLIRDNLFDFIINPKLYNETDGNREEKLNYVILNLLALFNINSAENLKSVYMENIFKQEILNKLLSFIWIFDNNNNIDDNNGKIKNKIYKENYCLLLIEYLKKSIQKSNNDIKYNSESQIYKIDKDKKIQNNNMADNRSSKNLAKDATFEINKDKKNEYNLIDFFIDKAIEHKKNPYIFSSMLNILNKINIVKDLNELDMNKFKSLIVKEIREKNEINNENKTLMYLWSLRILFEYYFSENDKNKLSKNKLKSLHLFIQKLEINMDLFHALIYSFKYLKNMQQKSNVEKDGIKKIIELENNDLSSFSDIPFNEINIKELNETQSFIITSVLEDIVCLFYKLESKNSFERSSKVNESFNSSFSSESNMAKEVYETLKKNIDIIFKYPGTELYNQIFSSENDICGELFYIKWKSDGDDNYIEKVIKKYHNDLLINHQHPFIFKFLLFASDEKILPFSIYDITKQDKEIKFRINIMIYIIETLQKNSKKISKEDSELFYISNLLNFLILINQELDYKENIIFENREFCNAIYTFIHLIEKKGILYSNYYIESNEKYGKIISEIIYDIFFAMNDNVFESKKFMEFFIKTNPKNNHIFTIFYLIDLCKENILNKDQKTKGDLEMLIPHISNLFSFHSNYLNVKRKKLKLFLSKKLYPIEDVNFSIYFIGKSLIYLKSDLLNNNKKLIKLLTETFLPVLSKNIIRLLTQKDNFYGRKACKYFPLYYFTKQYFEYNLIQTNNVFFSLDKFFQSDMKVNLKEEYNIYFCFASRFIHDIRKVIEKIRNPSVIILNKSESFYSLTIKDVNLDYTFSNLDKIDKGHNSSNNLPYISTKIIFNSKLKDLSTSSTNLNSEEFESKSIHSIKDIEYKDFYSSFEMFTNNNIIFNPRKFFFKVIFPLAFKDMIFNDKIFKDIKLAFLLKFMNYDNLTKETKQMAYPVKQKNYSNFLEPKIFLKRDFNFYDPKFFDLSHSYIPKEVLEQKKEDIIFYPHKYRYAKEKDEKSLFCELVTTQNLYFGKMTFLKDYIVFETKVDPRDDSKNNYDLNIFLRYGISTRNKDNITNKKKIIIIFNEDLKEVIQRRTLLINQSLEIFITNGKSYFFNFFKTEEVKKAYTYFNDINKVLKQKNTSFLCYYNIKDVVSKFRNGEITNYEYLLYLNKYSTRTYNDLSQYPVFPWLVLDHWKLKKIFEIKNEQINEKEKEISSYIRKMNYAISIQSEESRAQCKMNYESEKKNPNHLNTHYSTPAYIFYYLMRLNPYGQNMLKLQSSKWEDPNRVFSSFITLGEILQNTNDNRELIPDFFCYFDYFCNLNCNYIYIENTKIFVDDFEIDEKELSKYTNSISSYANLLYLEKKLLNTNLISKEINKWVDIIFGYKQLPEKPEEAKECCNIYNKLTYEQKTNFELKFAKNVKLIKQKKKEIKVFINRMRDKIDIVTNVGMCPKKILDFPLQFYKKNKTFPHLYKVYKAGEDKLIHFKKLPEDKILILKDEIKKNQNPSRIAVVYENKNFKPKKYIIYNCKTLNLLEKYKNIPLNIKGKIKEVPLYNPEYSISFLYLIDNISKSYNPIILSCRYLGNYFALQFQDKKLNIYCEDFVTCIKGRNLIEKGDQCFYTGLLNGKLTEWKLTQNFAVNETKHAYAHISSITSIEVYSKQRIILTAGEDKFIYIRKIYDFELLTVIDLTNCFGNPIISQMNNIFPISIRVSELNLLYVLLYDYETKSTFIRGYNLNGLFFAQTDDNIFIDKNNKRLQINNISFTKSSDLIIGFYNANKCNLLKASTLMPIYKSQNIKNEENINYYGINWIEYDYSLKEFYLLYDSEFYIQSES